MVLVSIKKDKNGIIESVVMKGHANYREDNDIVCASISTMLIVSVNAILEFDNNAIKVEEGSKIVLKNLKKDDITNKLLINLEKSLYEIQKQYERNIKIKEE
jgi:uncharacterized protein